MAFISKLGIRDDIGHHIHFEEQLANSFFGLVCFLWNLSICLKIVVFDQSSADYEGYE